MRPVNLIPPGERRGEQAPLRTGPLAYIVLAALVLVLVGVTAMVVTSNQIGDREAEVASLEHEDARAASKARRLVAYTEFQTLSEQRVATVSELADSRFDWERVMRELSLTLPGDVSLTDLEATAAGEGEAEAGGGAPTLTLNGCATGQEGVAGFVTALKDIDGVTRVLVESSSLAGAASDAGPAASTEVGADTGGSGSCGGAGSALFSIVVTFDAAPVAEPGGEGEAATEAAPTSEETAGG